MSETIRRAVLCASFIGASALAAGEDLSVSDGRWELEGKGIVRERIDGRDAFAVESGLAYRRDVRLQDGTIEFDVQLTRRRSFVYLAFRMESDQEHEEVYLRPHKSGLPDAIQYAPVYQGQSAWQLFHGPGATAAVDFEPGVWTHVRLEVWQRMAALFVGGQERPALVMPLARASRPGYLALRGFLPVGSPGSGPIARFSNVRIDTGRPAFAFPAAPPPAAVAGVVRAWSVSHAFVPSAEIAATLPPADVLGGFRPVEAEPNGRVELHRHVPLPKGSRVTAAVARLHVRASKERLLAFDLGFSDRATVFVNGRPIFAGEGSYSFDSPRREGLIGYDQARVWLPLVAGDNELSVLVSDGFGGWGLMGRFPDENDLQVDPR